MSACDPLSDEELLEIERLAGFDLGAHALEGDGARIAALVAEVRRLRPAVERALEILDEHSMYRGYDEVLELAGPGRGRAR